jgi:ATP-dependent Clp protease ATP-binding subunit ClpB
MEHSGNRKKMAEVAMSAARGHFRPEFLNRIDDIIVFNPLTRADIGSIVDIQMRELNALLEDREMRVILNEEAREMLGDLGYDPAYGARPLKRAILRYLKNPLSMQILDGNFGEGDEILIGIDGNAFTFRRDESGVPEPDGLEDSFVLDSPAEVDIDDPDALDD